MSDEELFGGAVILRPHQDGSFDELVLMDGTECRVHMEMMRDNCLFIGIYPRGTRERVAMWIEARGKLNVRVEKE